MRLRGTIYRFRRQTTPNRYNPGEEIQGDWDTAVKTVIHNAAILPAGTKNVLSENDRTGAVLGWTLFAPPEADIRKGDGFSLNDEDVTPSFVVEQLPSSPVNPFNGWQPVLQVDVLEVQG